MKTKLMIAVACLAGATMAQADLFDLGAIGTSYFRSYDFGQLNGTSLNGQTVSFDLNFNNSVHLFSRTESSFLIGVGFQTNGSNSGFGMGSGYILDALGNPMCAMRPLGSARNDTGLFFVALFPLWADETGLLATDITRPLDFYGVHFELILPDNDLRILSGELVLSTVDFTQNGTRTQGFRIGPHVPDSGSTIFLLAGAIIPLLRKARQ